jgi:hypothetical protein
VKRGSPKNIVASVQARLVERSRELGVEHQLTLARFGGERLLYRLSMNSAVVARTDDWSEGETAPAALSELAD